MSSRSEFLCNKKEVPIILNPHTHCSLARLNARINKNMLST
jgi:hypothetical protein